MGPGEVPPLPPMMLIVPAIVTSLVARIVTGVLAAFRAKVTVNVYGPSGTDAPTKRLIGRLCDVAPDRIVATRPALEKLTVVASARLNPPMITLVVTSLATRLGSMPEMIGGTSTVKGWGLVAVPLVFVTVMGPVVAPVGTVVVIELAVADVTVAGVPLNLTWLLAVVGLNPKPSICTMVPTSVLEGEKKKTPIAPPLPPAGNR